MIPSAWQLALLALGVYRLWRIAGLDDVPWLNRARMWIVGAYAVTPETWAYRRPRLAQMISCSWCLGFWVSLSATACWFIDARWTLLAATPFALATLVGWLGHLLNE